jgi:hypothetical protein
MAVAPSLLKEDGRYHQILPPKAAAIGDEGDGPCIGSARGSGRVTAVAAMGPPELKPAWGRRTMGLSIRRSWRRWAGGRFAEDAGSPAQGQKRA